MQQHTPAHYHFASRSKTPVLLAAVLSLLLAACSYNLGGGGNTASNNNPGPAGFTPQWWKQGDAYMFTATREGRGGPTFLVIEGDGAAYDAWGNATADPTPMDHVASDIALAIARDYPHAKVIYAARPCQYLKSETVGKCPSNLWRLARFGKSAQNFYLNLIGNDQPIIVGYSGGGVIAAHLAAQGRARALVTVASPLALNRWAAHHNLTPFPLSDDPMMVRRSIRVHERHLVGTRDDMVPPNIGEVFARQSLWVVKGHRHNSDWREPVLQAIRDLSYEL